MDPAVFSPLDILRTHTIDNAEALGVDEQVGNLEASKLADLLIIDLGQPVTGALFELPASLVFSTCAADIESVIVRGEIKASGLLPSKNDIGQFQAKLKKRVTALMTRQLKTPTE